MRARYARGLLYCNSTIDHDVIRFCYRERAELSFMHSLSKKTTHKGNKMERVSC